jgi:hypothetical protein
MLWVPGGYKLTNICETALDTVSLLKSNTRRQRLQSSTLPCQTRLVPPTPREHLLKELLHVSLIVVITALSLKYFSGNSVVETPPKSRPDNRLRERAADITDLVDHINSILIPTKNIYTTYFVDHQFTTSELTSHPDAKAIIDLLHDPLGALANLDSNISFSDCKPIHHSLETCANWSTSAAFPSPVLARVFLHTANADLHRCIGAVEDAAKQHDYLSRLAESFIEGESVLNQLDNQPGALPVSLSSPDNDTSRLVIGQAQASALSNRITLFKSSMIHLSTHVKSWHDDERGPLFSKFLADARAFLYNRSEDLAVLAAKSDGFLEDDLAVFSE